MVGYCMSVRLYFHEPQVSENIAQECNIQPYNLLNHQIFHYISIHCFIGNFFSPKHAHVQLKFIFVHQLLLSLQTVG